MTEKRRIELRLAYEYAFDTITYWGLNTAKGKHAIFKHTRLFVVWATALTLYVSMMIKTLTETRFEVLIGNMYLSTSEATYILKLINYLLKRRKIAQIDELLTTDVFTSYNDSQHKYIVQTVHVISRLSKLFRYMIIVWIFACILFPIIDNTSLILPGWFPFDIAKYRWFIITYQLSSIGLSALINSSIDIITVGYISSATAHFSIVKDILMNIKKGADPAEVKQTIARCSYYHKRTIDITKQIEDVFSYGLLVQFIASIMILCITGFEMLLVSQTSAEFVMLMSYLGVIMAQVSLYCWFGHDLTLKSQEVRDACYLSDWTEYDGSIRKMLFIIMERSKTPIQLTAGKFFYLNIPTLVNVNDLRSKLMNLLIICGFCFFLSSRSLELLIRILRFCGVYLKTRFVCALRDLASIKLKFATVHYC